MSTTKCSHVGKTGRCMRPRMLTSENGLCKYHTQLQNEDTDAVDEEIGNFNELCPICQEEDLKTKLYPLPCTHMFHLACLSGMNKLDCPMCRTPMINLPKEIRKQILKNGEQYEEEKNQEYDNAVAEMQRRELEAMPLQQARLPPQYELILALKYVFQLGVPVSLIPIETILELDPLSPLPQPGSIFQNAVRQILTTIRERSSIENGNDEHDLSELTVGGNSSEEDSDFQLEGENLQIVHRIRTVPSREFISQHTREVGTAILRSVASLFMPMHFNIATVPEITQEDLLNLGMGEYTGEE